MPVTRSRATVEVPPLDQLTVMEAGALTSCMSVITKCHSTELHSWSVNAFAWIVIMPPPVVVDVLVVPAVVVDVFVPVDVPVLVPVEEAVVVVVDVPVVVPVEVPVVVPVVVLVDVPVVVPVEVPVDVPVLVDVLVVDPDVPEVPDVPVVVPLVLHFTLKTLLLSPPGVIPFVCFTVSL